VAITGEAHGLYNVVDDEPAEVSEWLRYLAQLVVAKAPRRIPAWLGRLLAGEGVVLQMTSIRGLSNARVKAELKWAPDYESWRTGFPLACV
jgi:nucleoside-diphosphate-sugar epimerase